MGTQTTVLAVTDDVVLPVSSVLTVMKVVGKEGVERCDPMIITQASTISNNLSSLPHYFLLLLSIKLQPGSKNSGLIA